MVINCFNMDCVLGSRICCLEIESLPWLLVRFHFLGNFSTYFLPKATPTTSCLFIVEILLIVGKQNSTSASRCRDQQLYFRTDIPLLLVDSLGTKKYRNSICFLVHSQITESISLLLPRVLGLYAWNRNRFCFIPSTRHLLDPFVG